MIKVCWHEGKPYHSACSPTQKSPALFPDGDVRPCGGCGKPLCEEPEAAKQADELERLRQRVAELEPVALGRIVVEDERDKLMVVVKEWEGQLQAKDATIARLDADLAAERAKTDDLTAKLAHASPKGKRAVRNGM